ncbi:MAG: hypothetical protein MJ200_04465 [Mycoplasmoidaceae bacterium]|nr:hypothetical protein [Mycoplasmoidaceae bacterium]
MKKFKFVIPSLLSVSLVPTICLTSCGSSEKKQSYYEWSIDGENFTYELISGVEGKEFKLRIVANSGFGISTNSYFTINDGEQRELQLSENVLTITADKIDGKIDIHIVTISLPNSISISYGEGQTEDTTLLEGDKLAFNLVVDPIECADNIKFITQNDNIAKFDGNELVPVTEGGPI